MQILDTPSSNRTVCNFSLSDVPCYSRSVGLVKKLKSDPSTYFHSLNVANLTLMLAIRTYPDISYELAFYSGLLHDIGKTEIDPCILNKPGSLTKEEFLRIKEHSVLGQKILEANNLPEEIVLSAYYHHEKYCGKGYPTGIKNNEIPAIARIVSICDVYDALTSNRPYRKAYSPGDAIRIMDEARLDFDEEYFREFLSLIIEKN